MLEFSGPTSAPISNSTCGFAQSDIDGYINFLNTTTGSSLTSTNVVSVAIDKSSAAPGNVPGGSASNFNIATDSDVEVALDLEVIVSVAQGANVVAYFTPITEQGWVDAVTQIVADTTNHPDVLSISWGWSELEADQLVDYTPDPPGDTPWPFEWTQAAYNQLTQAFQSAANIGMTVFVSAGDNGSDCGEDDGKAHVLYPGSDPWVTSCGGTIVNGLSPLSQDTWNDSAVGAGATGGGVSYLVGPQSWQGSLVPKSANGDGHQGRGVPDVAGNASPLSGYVLWLYGQSSNNLLITAPPFAAGNPLGPVGGTSAVGPLYAALTALINASLDTRLGYLNPTIYALGGSVFTDINDGVSNSVPTASGGNSPGYTSGPGWDAVTGWGTFNGGAFLSALKPIYLRATSLILDRSTFGKDEVTAATSGGIATFTDAVYVVADGFIPEQLGLNSGNLNNPPIAQIISFAGTFPSLAAQGVTLAFDTTTGVQLENPQDFLGPQRITFPFNVVFSSLNAFSGISASPGYQEYGLSATVATIAGGGTPAESAQSSVAVLELTLQADPYLNKGATWWLNDDMRVFTVTPATLRHADDAAAARLHDPVDRRPEHLHHPASDRAQHELHRSDGAEHAVHRHLGLGGSILAPAQHRRERQSDLQFRPRAGAPAGRHRDERANVLPAVHQLVAGHRLRPDDDVPELRSRPTSTASRSRAR